MARIVRREIRKRGFFGWVFLLIFVIFNLMMLGWSVSWWGTVMNDPEPLPQHARAATAGTVIATAILLGIWAAGAIVTGMFVLLTRGKKILIEETVDEGR